MKEKVTIGMVAARLLVNQVVLLQATSELLLKHCTTRSNGQGPIDQSVIHANVNVCEALRESKKMLQKVCEPDEHM